MAPKRPPLDLSERMRRIKKRDTKPELTVRRIVFQLGYRYRLYRGDLPGTPDLTFASRRKVIFVHGCFWHQHDCRLGRKQPKSNQSYWLPKLQRNQDRDSRAIDALKAAGWTSLVIWECQTRDETTTLARVLSDFLR